MSTSMLLLQLGSAGVFFSFLLRGEGGVDISPLALTKKRDFESRHLKKKVLLQTYFVILEKKSPCQISYCTFYDMEQKKIYLYCFQKGPSTFGEGCDRNKAYN